LPLLAGFTERQWVVPRTEDLEMIDAILDANNLTVKAAIDKLGTVCQDFLLVCVFAGKTFPCFQVIYRLLCGFMSTLFFEFTATFLYEV
jgi:acid-sensing ion channel, other